jgi:hypothetical protein
MCLQLVERKSDFLLILSPYFCYTQNWVIQVDFKLVHSGAFELKTQICLNYYGDQATCMPICLPHASKPVVGNAFLPMFQTYAQLSIKLTSRTKARVTAFAHNSVGKLVDCLTISTQRV